MSSTRVATRRLLSLLLAGALAACGGGRSSAGTEPARIRVTLSVFGTNPVVPAGVASLELHVTGPTCDGALLASSTVNVSPGLAAPPFDLTLPATTSACFELWAWSGPGGTGQQRYHGVSPGVVLAADALVEVTIPVLPVDPAPPSVLTLPPLVVLARQATAQGSVDAGASPAVAWIEWGASAAYGQVTPIQQVTAVPFTVTAVLTGLQPSTTYHYRVVAAGAGQTVAGQDVAFTTAAPEAGAAAGVSFGSISPPAVDAPSLRSVGRYDVQLVARLAGNGGATHAYLELQQDGAWSRTSALHLDASGAGQSSFEDGFSGLALGTAYAVRQVALNAGGVSTSEPVPFTTADGAWTAPAPLAGGTAANPALARRSGGGALVAFRGAAGVEVAGELDGAWAAAEPVIAGGFQPAIAPLDGDRAVVAARVVNASACEIQAVVGSPGAWSAPTVLATWEGPACGFSELVAVSAGDGSAVVAWGRPEPVPGVAAIRWVEGAGFGPTELLDTQEPTHLLASGSGGRVVVAWGSAFGKAILAREHLAGEGWSPRLTLSAGTTYRFLRGLELSAAGTGAVLWVELDQAITTGTIMAVRSDGAGWSLPEVVGSTGAALDASASLALDARGRGVAVWREEGGACDWSALGVDGRWSPPQPVGLPECDRPTMLLDPGGQGVLLATYRGFFDQQEHTGAIRHLGGGWEVLPVALAEPRRDARGLAWPDGRLVAALGTTGAATAWFR